jgi:hypothetical protein
MMIFGIGITQWYSGGGGWCSGRLSKISFCKHSPPPPFQDTFGVQGRNYPCACVCVCVCVGGGGGGGGGGGV